MRVIDLLVCFHWDFGKVIFQNEFKMGAKPDDGSNEKGKNWQDEEKNTNFQGHYCMSVLQTIVSCGLPGE